MNTKTMIIAGVVVVVAIGAWMLMLAPKSQKEAVQPPATNTQGGQKGSLKALMALGTSQECTFTDSIDGSQSSGTIYVSGGKMRGDFTTVASGKTTQNHMIAMNETSYMWGDEMPGGIKISMTAAEKPQGVERGSVDLDKETNYSCNSWPADASKFNLPAGIEFQDMSAMMQGMQGGPTQTTGTIENPDYSPVKDAQCGACDQAPEPQRSQCRAALACK